MRCALLALLFVLWTLPANAFAQLPVSTTDLSSAVPEAPSLEAAPTPTASEPAPTATAPTSSTLAAPAPEPADPAPPDDPAPLADDPAPLADDPAPLADDPAPLADDPAPPVTPEPADTPSAPSGLQSALPVDSPPAPLPSIDTALPVDSPPAVGDPSDPLAGAIPDPTSEIPEIAPPALDEVVAPVLDTTTSTSTDSLGSSLVPGDAGTGGPPSGDGLPVLDQVITPLETDVTDLGTGEISPVSDPPSGPLGLVTEPLDSLTQLAPIPGPTTPSSDEGDGLLAPVTDLLTPPAGGGGEGLLAPVTDLLTPPSGGGGGGLLAPITDLLTPPAGSDGLLLLAPPAIGDRPTASPIASPSPADPIALPQLATPTAPAAPLGDLAPPGGPHAATLGALDPSTLTGPWAPFAALAQAILASTAQTPVAAPPAAHGNLPVQAPEPGSSGGVPAGGGSGVAFSLLLALLFSIAAFALQHYSRLRLPPAQWRPFTFVAVIERPG